MHKTLNIYKKNIKVIFLILFLLFSNVALQAKIKIIQPIQQHSSSFAIIVDDMTYEKISDAINAYRDAVENDGLSTFILADKWKNPEEIKAEIIKLYNGKPKLEGVVFIGDVPIPMIRNAQHMTSAFKLDEYKYPYFESSIASDCFYDDFDLKFKYLEHDTVHTLSYYYSMLPDSPQRIEKEIYSGRIKPSGEKINKYEVIKNYLLRISKQKNEQNFLKNAFVFTGHGYYSQSLTAWADERLSLVEQFPQLFKPEGRIKNLQYSFSDDMKNILKIELQLPEMDMAIFHAHGDDDLQLLLNYPEANNVSQNIESVKLYLRNKLRSAKRRHKSIGDAKDYFMKEYNVPESWFEGAFNDSVTAADSLLDFSLDMHIQDVRNISPQPKFIMFDECFNGSYHENEYIAGEYVFGKGKVIAAEANSVNTLQDRWADEFMGLINEGVRIGQWHKLKNSLESVILGDPTFHYNFNSKNNLNQLLNANNLNEWKDLEKSKDPVVRSLAINMIYKSLQSKYEDELVRIYKNDPSPNVRLHALKCLGEIDGKGFREVLKESINDPFEFIRRLSAIWMGEIGDSVYLPLLVKQDILDESSRVSFNARNSIGFFNSKEAIAAVNDVINNLPDVPSNKVTKEQLVNSINHNDFWLYKEILPTLENDTLSIRKRVQQARTFRNYRFHEAVPELISLMSDHKTNVEIRTAIAEALGWFNLSIEKNKIVTACDKIISNNNEPESLRAEAERTKGRLITGLNNSIIP